MSTAEAMLNRLRVSGSKTPRFVNISHEEMFAPDQTTSVSVKLREFAWMVFGYRTPSAQPATEDPRIRHFLKLTNGLVELKHEEFDEEFLEPTKHAYESTLQFMLEAHKALRYDLLVPRYIPDGEGGIRVEWVKGSRELRLICPAEVEKPVYLYYEDGENYGVVNQATNSVLIDRLRWLNNT